VSAQRSRSVEDESTRSASTANGRRLEWLEIVLGYGEGELIASETKCGGLDSPDRHVTGKR
jgi:hypothetical protein